MKQMNRAWVLSLLVAGAVVQAGFCASNRASRTIDRLVFSKLDELGIPPSELCTDEVFLRRVYLDMTGTLPTPQECQDFFSFPGTNRRGKLIEELFARGEFADYWAMKWCDLLRVKAEFPSNLWPNAVQAYHRWLRTAIFNNMPYDEFARALLTSSGSNFRVAPVNFYRAVPRHEGDSIAQVVALTFMGMRTDGWDRERLMGMATFFGSVGYKKTAEWKEEIVFFDPSKRFVDPETQQPVVARFPDGTEPRLQPGQDPREVFADWLVESDAFSQSIVNRIWYWLLGRGIVHEPDDFCADNPPQNAALLDFLAKELVRSGYDLRHIYRIILNSKTYQLSSIHNEGNREDEVNFSHYLVRRMDAEVLIDAINQITHTTETYSSAIPEPFTWIPENQRAVELADGSITSPFLDLFGRPPRDSGYESERNNTPSTSQRLHMLNSTHIQKKIMAAPQLLGMYYKKADLGKKKKAKPVWRVPEKAVEHKYLTVLSRYPTEHEAEVVLAYVRNSGLSRRDAFGDVAWALLNTKEFVYKH
jgi:hypothetical protein